MNLRKATKNQLIREIRRLRHYEKMADELHRELERRDKAKAIYQGFEEEALCWAMSFEFIKKDWDFYWQCADPWDSFWEERKADRVSEFMKMIENILGEKNIKAMQEAVEKTRDKIDPYKPLGAKNNE